MNSPAKFPKMSLSSSLAATTAVNAIATAILLSTALATIATPSLITALPAPNPNPNPNSNRRGLPPLCWTDEETLALIDCYREKWYSHNRSNLRAAHWDEVAAAVAARSRQIPTATPKTSVQCRHKIEKLRKRYRAERQRSLALNPRGPPSSPWIFFGKIDQMENPNPNPNPNPNWYGEEVGNGGLRFKIPVALRNPNPNWDRECDDDGGDGNVVASNGGGGSAGGLKSKIPMAVQASVGNPNPNASWAIPIGIPNPNFNLAKGGMDEVRRRMEAKRQREEEDDDDDDEGLDGIGEMAKALRMLGDGYMRMEQMKMDMAREMEQARMDMELKRTEMILDTQRRIVDGFVKGYAGEKKVKRSTDS